MRSLLSLALLGAAIAGAQQQQNPEPVAPPVIQPPKLLIDPKQPLVMPYLKKCNGAVTVTAVEGTQQFVLDTAATHIKWSGTLYNMAGEEVTTFKAVKTRTFAQQICSYFEALMKGDQQ